MRYGVMSLLFVLFCLPILAGQREDVGRQLKDEITPNIDAVQTKGAPISVSLAAARREGSDLLIALDVTDLFNPPARLSLIRFRIFSEQGAYEGVRTFGRVFGSPNGGSLAVLRLSDVAPSDLVIVTGESAAPPRNGTKDALPEVETAIESVLSHHRVARPEGECQQACLNWNRDCQQWCWDAYGCTFICTECTLSRIPPCDSLSCYCYGGGSPCPAYCDL